MIDLKFENDLIIESGDLATVEEPQAGAQRIKDRLKTFKGEWFLDLSFGPDYRKDILIKNPRLDIVNAVIKNEILKSQDGTFSEFNVTLNQERRLEASYQLDTTSGIIADTVTI